MCEAPEVVALRLQQVRWQTGLADAVVVRQRSGECWHRHAQLDTGDDDVAPRILNLGQSIGEVRSEQQVLQIWSGVERFFDPFQEASTDDATTAPQQRDITVIQRPNRVPWQRLATAHNLGHSCKSCWRTMLDEPVQ